MASIIDSLKRLERAGSEHSRATEKLHTAARDVARLVKELVPVGVILPRGYEVRRIHSNVGSDLFLVAGGYWVDGCGGYLHGDFRCPIPPQTREASLRFAEDIATGWLDELAEWLEQRAAEDEAATATLQAAAERLASS